MSDGPGGVGPQPPGAPGAHPTAAPTGTYGGPARPPPSPPAGIGTTPGQPAQRSAQRGSVDRTTARGGSPPRTPPTAVAGGTAPRPVVRSRRARLALRRIDPWSVFVLSLLVSMFLGVVTIVAGFVLWAVLDTLGVPNSINTAVTEVRGGAPPFTASRFVGIAALLAAVNIVLLTAMATLGALLYNICASFTGGIEVTLAEGE